MPDIKTREKVKGTIKALDRSAVAAQRMKKAYIQSKRKAEHSVYSSESSPDEYAADKITDTAQHTVHEATYHGDRIIHTGISSIKKTAESVRNHSKPISATQCESPETDLSISYSVDPSDAPVEIEPEIIQHESVPHTPHPQHSTPDYITRNIHTEANRPNTTSATTPITKAHQISVKYPLSGNCYTPIIKTGQPVPPSTPVSAQEHTNTVSPRVRYTRSGKSIKTLEQNRATIKQTTWSTGSPIPVHTKESTKIRPRIIRTPHTITFIPEQSIRTSAGTAQASVQVYRTVLQAVRHAAQKATSSSKTISVAAKSAVKSIIAGTQALISILAAGGSVSMIIIVLILMIGLIAGSSYGIFLSGETTGNEMTMRDVVQEVNNEYQAKLDDIINSNPSDELLTSGSRATWPEILAVYAVKLNTDTDSPLEVASMDEEKKSLLKEIFWAMNDISYRIETQTETQITKSVDEDGNITETEATITRQILHIKISHKTAEEMAVEFHFTNEQLETLRDLLSEDNARLWSSALYGIHFGSTDIVAVAASQLGNVGGEPYWRWYGFTSRVEWCACFVSWCANECGYIESGVVPKFAGCVLGAQWFKDHRQWAVGSYEPPSGAIIFFDWDGDGRSDHVGIVEKVENGIVYTIEGNSGDACRRRSYPVGWYEIYGYAFPTG